MTLRVALVPALAIAACSDDGVGSPQSGTAGTAAGTADAGDDRSDAADDGGTAAGDDGTGGAPEGTGNGEDDAGTAGDDGTTGGPSGEPECQEDRDCMVVNDCCSCGAVPVGTVVGECPKACLQSACDAIGLHDAQAECRFGLCQLARKSCDASEVRCDSPTPPCPGSSLPEVGDGCWTGECVPVEFCAVVPSCEACARHEICIAIESQLGPRYACETPAPACEGEPSCECMAEACPEAYATCVDGQDGISCTCPRC